MMIDPAVERSVLELGRGIYDEAMKEGGGVFSGDYWMGRGLRWVSRDEDLKGRVLGFISRYGTKGGLKRYANEYFCGCEDWWARFFLWYVNKVGEGGVMEGLVRMGLGGMARQFIVGSDLGEVSDKVRRLRDEGFGGIVDVLGEFVESEEGAEGYLRKYKELIEEMGKWEGEVDWGYAPGRQVAVKVSSLYGGLGEGGFEEEVEGVAERLGEIGRNVMEVKGGMCVDMESTEFYEVTKEAFRRFKLKEEFRGYGHFGIAVQAYLKKGEEELREWIGWVRENKVEIEFRLVKGAYWDSEVRKAKERGEEVPVYEEKWETDAAYERMAKLILRNADVCYLACASHNIRTLAVVECYARAYGVGRDRYEYQLLYGMGGGLRNAIRKRLERVRLYAPMGDWVSGMGYLVRRLLENTANESFLRQMFLDGSGDVKELLREPGR